MLHILGRSSPGLDTGDLPGGGPFLSLESSSSRLEHACARGALLADRRCLSIFEGTPRITLGTDEQYTFRHETQSNELEATIVRSVRQTKGEGVKRTSSGSAFWQRRGAQIFAEPVE